MARRSYPASVRLGLVRVPEHPIWESQPDYVEEMNRRSKIMTDNLIPIFETIKDATAAIMLEVLEPTFEAAKYYTPKDTHELVNSGYLEDTSTKGRPRVEMGFAYRGHPHYAVIQHENMSFEHNGDEQAKFLEVALMDDLGGIRKRLIEAYGKMVR